MISVAIMAHPSRREFVTALLERLDAPAGVVWDERNDRWDTGRRSLLAHDPEATHHLVVQDDAITCRDLVAGVEQITEAVADHPIALYTGRARPRTEYVAARVDFAQYRGDAFFEMEGPLWGVGIVLPRELIAPAVEWGDAHPEIANYDIRLARFFESRRLSCFYTVPSLLEHRDTPSLVEGRNGAGRHAFTFIGAGRSALEVDWSRVPERPSSGWVELEGDAYACWDCPRIFDRLSKIEFHRRRHD